MRLLHLDSGREMRGGQWQVLYLLEGLAARGHSVVLLAPAGSPLHRQAAARALEVRPWNVWSALRFSRRCDLVHAHDARSHTLAALFARRPLVVSRRVAFLLKTGPGSRWKYARAARFIAVSQHVGEILENARVAPGRIAVVYDGVEFPEEVAPPSNRSGVVALATDDPAKGADLIREAARSSGIDVMFSRTLPADLASAAVFVYVTRSEGLGSAALLAMASGAAVIASRTGGLPEVVEHRVTGLLTDNNPREIAQAMRRLLDDPDLAASLVAQGRARVRDRFSLARMIDETLAVYERILR
ncbi:MAG: glycosyltransferase family 4 protein [Bryobacteraceae bacterium]